MFVLTFTSFMALHAQWARTYGANLDDSANAILQTSDGGYIVTGLTFLGAGEGDFWVLKLFSTGDIEWQKTYGGSYSDRPRCIQQTTEGGFIIAGKTHSFGGGEADCWVFELSVDGEIEWQKTYGETDFDDAHTIQQTADGDYIVAGSTRSFNVLQSDFLILMISSNGEIADDCGFIRSSSANVTDTFILPTKTDAIPRDTNVNPQNSNTSPYDTTAIENLICGRGGKKKGMKRR